MREEKGEERRGAYFVHFQSFVLVPKFRTQSGSHFASFVFRCPHSLRCPCPVILADMQSYGLRPDAFTLGTLLVKNIRLGTAESVQTALARLSKLPRDELDITTATIWLRYVSVEHRKRGSFCNSGTNLAISVMLLNVVAERSYRHPAWILPKSVLCIHW